MMNALYPAWWSLSFETGVFPLGSRRSQTHCSPRVKEPVVQGLGNLLWEPQQPASKTPRGKGEEYGEEGMGETPTLARRAQSRASRRLRGRPGRPRVRGDRIAAPRAAGTPDAAAAAAAASAGAPAEAAVAAAPAAAASRL